MTLILGTYHEHKEDICLPRSLARVGELMAALVVNPVHWKSIWHKKKKLKKKLLINYNQVIKIVIYTQPTFSELFHDCILEEILQNVTCCMILVF